MSFPHMPLQGTRWMTLREKRSGGQVAGRVSDFRTQPEPRSAKLRVVVATELCDPPAHLRAGTGVVRSYCRKYLT